jgi:hypothetical protein
MTVTYSLLVNAVITGLLMGGFYAALSVGATIAFGLLDIVNIAHPTFAVIGAYAVLVLNRTFNIDPMLGGLLLTPVFYGAGMLLYQLYHHSFEKRGDDAMRGLAFFFGLMFIAEVVLIMLFGVDFRYVHAPYITTTWNFGAIALPLRLAVPFAGSLLMLIALELFLKKLSSAAPLLQWRKIHSRCGWSRRRRYASSASPLASPAPARRSPALSSSSSSRCNPPSAASSSAACSRSACSAASAVCRARWSRRFHWGSSKTCPRSLSAHHGRRRSPSVCSWRR